MADRVPLHADDVTLGEPLPWTVFDQDGNALLRHGTVIRDAATLQRLLARRPLRADSASRIRPGSASAEFDEADEARPNPFDAFEGLKQRAGQAFQLIGYGQPEGVERCLRLVATARDLFESAPDACIGLIHQGVQGRTPEAHALCCLWLVQMVASHQDTAVAPELLAAALTANLGMMTIQEKLNHQHGELTAEQQQAIRNHPSDSVWMLKRAGVSHRAWLMAVYQHHERSSGEGYPKGLKGDAIADWARIIGIVDCYLAMVGKRAYKEAQTPQQALRYFLECGNEHDEALSNRLIRSLGVYPPGSCVQLANGEYAIVIRRNLAKPVCPSVRAVASSEGAPYNVANFRDTSVEETRIKRLAGHKPALAVPLPALWGYA